MEKNVMIEKYEYRKNNHLTTEIFVDLKNRKVSINNLSNDYFDLAFGKNNNPNIEDFEDLLEYRCFPKTRDHLDLCLKQLGLEFYDPYAIIDITQGRMEGDDYTLVHIES